MHYIVTGANRGIGLELVRQLLARKERVTATARTPDKASELQSLKGDYGDSLRIVQCDVTNEAAIGKLVTAIGTEAVDVLINNAGIGSGEGLDGFDSAKTAEVYHTNAIAPVLVTRALLPALRASKQSKVANISSLMGSVADNGSSGSYAYRMSKAALNMATKCLALDLASDGVSVIAMHPGWVQTDMGGKRAPVVPSDSVKGLLQVIDGLKRESSGLLIDFRGKTLPY